jgi:hypothetical protein
MPKLVFHNNDFNFFKPFMVNKQGKWLHASGKKFARTIVITIANYPVQEVEKLFFKPDAINVATGDPNNPAKYIELPSVELEKNSLHPE